MKAYSVCSIDNVGFRECFEYRKTKSSAMQCFNQRIKTEIEEAGDNAVSLQDFIEAVKKFKEFPATNNIVCIKEPVIIYENEFGFKANVYQYFEGSVKDNKDIIAITVEMKEIEICD